MASVVARADLSKYCKNDADAPTVAGFLDRDRGTGLTTGVRSLVTFSVIVFTPVASR
jgi:hypothetical protein